MATKMALMTKQVTWIKLRAVVVIDDATVLGATTKNFANRSAGTGNAVPVPEGINEIIVTFLGTPAGQSAVFTWKLYGFRHENGVAEEIANGTGNIGSVAATIHPITKAAAAATFYADFLAISAQYWPKTVSVVDVGAAGTSIAKIIFDGFGIKYLLLELTTCDKDTSNETDELEAIYTGL